MIIEGQEFNSIEEASARLQSMPRVITPHDEVSCFDYYDRAVEIAPKFFRKRILKVRDMSCNGDFQKRNTEREKAGQLVSVFAQLFEQDMKKLLDRLEHPEKLPQDKSVISLKKKVWFDLTFARALLLGLQGEVDHEAVCIPENAFGTSTGRPIGCHTIERCLGIILRNPKTNKTLVAHITSNTASLDILDLKSLRQEGEFLEVTVLGAAIHRSSKPDHQKSNQENERLGAFQRERVLKFLLAQKDISIKGWDVNHPYKEKYAFIVDPATGIIRRGVPLKYNLDGEVVNGLVSWTGYKMSLWDVYSDGPLQRTIKGISALHKGLSGTELYKLLWEDYGSENPHTISHLFRYYEIARMLGRGLREIKNERKLLDINAAIQYANENKVRISPRRSPSLIMD